MELVSLARIDDGSCKAPIPAYAHESPLILSLERYSLPKRPLLLIYLVSYWLSWLSSPHRFHDKNLSSEHRLQWEDLFGHFGDAVVSGLDHCQEYIFLLATS
jgi:hypothetical protein